MRNTSTLVNAPKLRFANFEGNWSKKLLGSISNKIGSGKTPLGGSEVYTTNGIPFIRSQNVLDNVLLLDETHISNEINESMKGSIVKPLDILLNITGGSIGRSCVVPDTVEKANVNQHVCIIRLKEEYNVHFLQPFISSFRGQKLILQGQTGSGREGLNFQSIRNFKIHFPSLPEQQKIASFLTAVDDKIALLNRQADLLKEYKKGLMQKIFNQEIRFKKEDGSDFSDWEKSLLGKIADIVGGGTPSTSIFEYWKGDINWFTPTEIKYKYVNRSLRKISKLGLTNSSAKVLPIGTLLFTSRATIGDMGITTEVCATNQGFQSFTPNENYSTEFLYYWITHNLKLLKRKCTGSTFIEISKSEIEKIEIELPTLNEQSKIGNLLKLLDEKTELVNQQINQNKAFKKGLLQQMFV